METLLCRRFDLARSSGRSLEDADPVARQHLDGCPRCQEVLRLDTQVADILTRQRAVLDDSARRRIEALVAVKAREEAPAPRRPLMGLAAAAVCVMVGTAGWLWSRADAPVAPVASELSVATPAIEPGEPLSGFSALIARHSGERLDAEAGLPDGALVFSARLPANLASQWAASSDGVATASWDGLPGPAVDDATLFVLDRQRVVLDPVLAELLSESGGVTLTWGPHQVTLSTRGDELFMVVASPGGLAPQVAGPYL